MAHSEEIIKKFNNQLKHADRIIAAQKRENEKLQQDFAQVQHEYTAVKDLLCAMMYTIGPRIAIRIDNFKNFLGEASFRGNIHLDMETFPFPFIANLEFSAKGDFSDIPEPEPTQE